MALIEKNDPKDKVEVAGQYKHVHVRSKTWVEKDGIMIGQPSYHRKTLAPTDDITGEDSDIQAICNAVWTEEIKSAYQNHLDSLQ